MGFKVVPDHLFDIPDNLSPGEFRHVCAQIAIQATVAAMGSKDVQAGTATISQPMLGEALALSIAMLVTADESVITPRDVRLKSDQFGKMIAGFAAILKDGEDTTGVQVLDMLGVVRSKLN